MDPNSLTRSPRTAHARSLFAGIAPQYDLMGGLLSFGQDRRWRRFMVTRVPQDGLVLDVATGTAGVAMELVRRKGARVIGVDASEPMLRRGGWAVERAGMGDQISLVLGRAEDLPFADGTFDAVTFTYLLRYVDDPAATLAELARVIKPGGVLANLEFHLPSLQPWRAGWYAYTRAGLPLLGRIASGEWYRAGRFLGPSISEFYRRYPLADQGRMWRAAGIQGVRHRAMSLGGGVVIWGTKRDA